MQSYKVIPCIYQTKWNYFFFFFSFEMQKNKKKALWTPEAKTMCQFEWKQDAMKWYKCTTWSKWNIKWSLIFVSWKIVIVFFLFCCFSLFLFFFLKRRDKQIDESNELWSETLYERKKNKEEESNCKRLQQPCWGRCMCFPYFGYNDDWYPFSYLIFSIIANYRWRIYNFGPESRLVFVFESFYVFLCSRHIRLYFFFSNTIFQWHIKWYLVLSVNDMNISFSFWIELCVYVCVWRGSNNENLFHHTNKRVVI